MAHRYPARAMPGPWSGPPYVPAPVPSSPFAFARTHMWPRFARQFLGAMGVAPPGTMLSPHLAPSVYSKSPVGAMEVVAAERHAMATLRQVPGAAAPQDIIRTHMPPVSRERIRSGAGVVPYWSIPFQPRSAPPEAVEAAILEFRAAFARAERGGVVGDQARAVRRQIMGRIIDG